MTTFSAPFDSPPERRDRRSRLLLLGLLILLFLAALGVFTFMMWRGGPRASLPDVNASNSGHPVFDRQFAQVTRPWAVATSPDGKRVYVAEAAGTYAVKVFDAKGNWLADATPPHTTETSRQPVSIAVSPDGASVYVVDRALQQLLRYDANGAFKDVIRPEGLDHWAPLGVAVDSTGLLYVTETFDTTDVQRHRVVEMQADGKILRAFGEKGTGASNLMFPNQIAIDGKGRVWVADMTGVKVFKQDGTYLFRIRPEGDDGVTLPGGIAYARDTIFITDVTNHRVIGFDVSGDTPKFKGQFGTMGIGKGQMRYPAGIAANGNRIWIANRENWRVDTWTE